ncbi:Zinc finger SWIM-type profile [Propionibacterium ruminifibrarum]|uniref:Zinc finger SWIM-type profile n=1 Tax=Propionibacterium ruminifibrarum TaxID=1962131 RepID=A0A375I3E6_9ACTN|nr:SWIM zinc finger family protein [Propionibacterium ruminifibrarum]SPF68234.1 Zinc finger SWIM-type profile [Propionibacterium ruminifibrarum]
MSTPAIERWTTERIDAQAPDAQTTRAGLKLAVPDRWPGLGVSEALLWGLCQGSGKKPYQVCVDLSGPAYKCSCPSRKFPCKHAVALLHLWSQGEVEPAEPADFAEEWRRRRADRATKAAAKTSRSERSAEQRADAEARAARREQRITDGLADLDRWLGDQLHEGLARAGTHRRDELRDMAARMVDAQAPGMATRLTALADVSDATPGWPAAVVEGFGMMRLLTRAWQRRAELPEDVAATVRSHLGVPVHVEDVLAGPGIEDTWAVLGMRDSKEGRVVARRVWLLGRRTGRWALQLSFAANHVALPADLFPGQQVEASTHPYPGRGQLRCALSSQREPQPLSWQPQPVGTAAARVAWRDAVALDPWTENHPVLVAGRLAVDDSGSYALSDDDGALPLVGGLVGLRRLALAAGRDDLVAFGELSTEGLRPLSVLDGGRVRSL